MVLNVSVPTGRIVSCMLFACMITAGIILSYWYRKKYGGRRFWTILVAYVTVISVFFAFLSVWAVWTPSFTSRTYHEGEYQGALPLNMLSYPFFLDVFHTWRCNPFHLCLKSDETCSGIVSFKIFFANIRVCEINGSFSYPLIIGEAPLNYKINLPFFETKQEFSVLLLSTFTLTNLAGAAVGVLTCSTVKRILKSRTFDS
jgi:hypothetical protein